MARVIFVSDLHLSRERPATNEIFFRFLAEKARDAAALYVLGDLFEYWIGDDDLVAEGGELGREVAAGFADLRRRGTRVCLMHGNRDFLMGERLCAAAGATLLDDPTVEEIGGERTILTHGDALCTDDVDYQKWRATARSEAWQRQFLAKSIAERRQLVGQMRETSRAVTRSKPPEITDVNAQAVRDLLSRHRVRRMIHGHTHRPALHEMRLGGRDCERWVLPDWYGTGGYLEFDGAEPRLVFF